MVIKRGLNLLLLSSFLAISSQGADRPWVGLLIPNSEGAPDLSSLCSRPEILSCAPVFEPAEARSLTSFHRGRIAHTLKLTFQSRLEVTAFRDFLERAHMPATLEGELRATPQEIGDLNQKLGGLLWQLENRGDSQKSPLDDLTRFSIPGVPGEDLGLSRLKAGDSTKETVVAILDTGIDLNHPDLKDHLFTKPKECEAWNAYQACLTLAKLDVKAQAKCEQDFAKVDTDQDGYPMDCHGWNFTSPRNKVSGLYGDGNTQDPVGHGTHVAGLVLQVSPHSRILPVRVIKTAPNAPIRPQSLESDHPGAPDSAPESFGDLIARGMLYAIRNGADVINLSMAWPAAVDSLLMREMVALAHERGILVVASAGNDSTDAQVMPCQYEEVLCVAAHGPDGKLSHFSNFGPAVQVAAPGFAILSTWPTSLIPNYYTALRGYEYRNGTSMASPLVAGAFARLLSLGLPPSEAYARLLAGTRPLASTQFGKIDLGLALHISPRPLWVLAKKAPLKALLTDGLLKTELPLDLFWTDSGPTRVKLTLVDSEDWALHRTEFDLPVIHAGERIQVPVELTPLSSAPAGRIRLKAELTEQGSAGPQTVLFEAEAFSTLNLQAQGIEHFPIRGNAVQTGSLEPLSTLRTIESISDSKHQDYLAVAETPSGLRLQLLREKDQGYDLTAQTTLPSQGGPLLLIQKLDLTQSGATDYVLIFQVPSSTNRGKLAFKFYFLNEKLVPRFPDVEYPNSPSTINERFQWLKIIRNGAPRLVPAWVETGVRPKIDQAPFDFWHPNATDVPATHLYYLAPEGVRSLPVPEESIVVAMLNPSLEQRRRGEISLLLGKGDDYILNYQVATVAGEALGTLRDLSLPAPRMFLGLNFSSDLKPVLALNGSETYSGTSLSTPSYRGATRMSVIEDPAQAQSADRILIARRPLDAVRQVDAVFRTDDFHFQAFSETNYDLQFHDLTTGQIQSTSLGRFSYLASFIFSRLLSPVTIEGPSGRLPGIYQTGSDPQLGDYTEVILPRESGMELSRPAPLRLVTPRGCSLLGNPLDATDERVSRLVYRCGEEFVRVPLSLKFFGAKTTLSSKK